MAATTADLVNEFIELEEQRKGKEGEIDKIKERLAELEPVLLERFEHAGMQSMKSQQGTVIYVRRDLWAGAKEGEEVGLLVALKEVGLGDMVKEKVNTQTLSAYVREEERDQFGSSVKATPEEIVGVLPAALRNVLAVTERYSLRTKKG